MNKQDKRGYNDRRFDFNSARDLSLLDVVNFDETSKEAGEETAGLATRRNGCVDTHFFKESVG